MKILGIIGSPHKNGNTDILVSKTIEGIKSKNVVSNKIYLDDLNLIPCKACYKCSKTGKCVLKDKFDFVLNEIKKADIIIFGSPVYCETVTAQTKILIDRIDSSQIIIRTVEGRTVLRRRNEWRESNKKGVIICVGDLSQIKELKQTSSVMKRLFKDLNIQLVNEILVPNLTKSGDVLNKPAILKNALRIGTKLNTNLLC